MRPIQTGILVTVCRLLIVKNMGNTDVFDPILIIIRIQMNKCEHGDKISKFCITEHCLHRQAAGCDYCMKKYHFHLANTRLLTDQDLLQLLKTLNQVPDFKTKSHKMTEAACQYLKEVKHTVNHWLDNAQKNIIEKLSYPFLKKNQLLNVYLRVKNRQYRKVTPKDLRAFHNSVESLTPEQIGKQQHAIYQQEIDWTWKLLDSVDTLTKAIVQLPALKEGDEKPFVAKNPKIKDLYETIKLESSARGQIAKRPTKPQSPKPPSLPIEGSTIMKHRMMRDSIDSDKGNSSMVEAKRQEPPKNPMKGSFMEKAEKEKAMQYLEVKKDDGRLRRFSIDDRIKDKKQAVPEKLADMEVSEQTDLSEQAKYELAHTDIPGPPPVPQKSEPLGKKEFTFPMAKKAHQQEIQSPIFNKKRKQNQQKKSGFAITITPVDDTIKESPERKPKQKEEVIEPPKDERIQLEQNEKNSLLLFGQALKADGQKAIQLLKGSLTYSPHNLSAAQYLSFLYIEGGRAKECLQVCEKVIALIANTPEEYECSLHIHNNRAAALNMLGRYSESITLLEQCLRYRRKHYFYKNLADAYFHLNIPEKAVMNYERAVRLDPGFDEAFYNLAVTQFMQEEYASAGFNIGQALKMDSSNEAYLELKEQINERIKRARV